VRRELKAGVLGLGVLALLGVVALAARGGHPTGNGRVSERQVPPEVESSLLTLMVVFYAVLFVALVIAAFRYRQSWREPDSNWLRNFATVVAVMTLLTVGYWAIARLAKTPTDERAAIAREQRIPKLTERRVGPRHATFNWPLALSVVGLVLVGGTVVFLRARRSRPTNFRRSVAEDLADAVGTTIEDLRRERDARRAVIAAYANMERVLASHGFARQGAEAPFEYLARILGGLNVRESAVRSLTQLFEYAKFSVHEIDSAMKEEAIAALEDVRTDLRGKEMLAA
jgi:uncharacterized protein DUF4129